MITIKQNDTGIGLIATLDSQGVKANLTNADVCFKFDTQRIGAIMDDPKNGKVKIVFDKSNTKKAGMFNAEFEVTYSDGKIETFPNDEYIRLNIMKNVGGK